mgnify:CR=1 FL=1
MTAPFLPFTRPTLAAAVELLEQHSQARFNQMVLRLGLEDEISSSALPKRGYDDSTLRH